MVDNLWRHAGGGGHFGNFALRQSLRRSVVNDGNSVVLAINKEREPSDTSDCS